MIDSIISNYKITEQEPVVLLRESSDNRVYTVGDTDKKILRVGKKISRAELSFEYEVLTLLKNKGVPVPEWILTSSGDVCVETPSGEVAVVFENISGYHASFDSELSTATHAFSAGAMLGMIAKAGENFTPKHARARTVYSELERALTYRRALEESLEEGVELTQEIERIIELTKERDTPFGLLHNDFRPGNVFFSDPKTVSGVIDFDWSCMGPLIKDLAHGAMEWSFNDGANGPDENAFNDFVAGYNLTAQYPFTDLKEIYLWAAQSALADTATFFCDRLNTDSTKNKVSSSYMYQKYLYFSKLL